MHRSSSSKFQGLQVLRAVAAISVLGYHGAAIEGELGGAFPKMLGFFNHFGYAGVDLFFVLSGFIIAWTAKNYSPDLRGVRDYTGERLARIFPNFWLMWLLSAFIYFVAYRQNYCHPDDVSASALLSLSLVSQQGHCIVPQAWTLSWELLFYLVVGALLPLFLRHKPWVATIWAILVLANVSLEFTQTLVLSYFCLYFVVGIAIASLIEKKLIIAPRAFTIVGTIWIIGTAFANWRYQIGADNLLARFLGFGVGSAMLIYGVVGKDASSSSRFKRAMSFLGDASYSIYLFHVTALFLMARWYTTTSSPAMHYAWVFGLVAMPLLVSAGLYLVMEKPVMSWFRSHRNGFIKIAAVASMGGIVAFAAPFLVKGAPNTSVATFDRAQKPVALSEVVSSSGYVVHVIDPREVDEIPSLMACSLDSVNGAAPSATPIIVTTNGVLVFSGWAQYPVSATSLTVILQGEKAYAFQARVGETRADIQEVTHSPHPISDILASSHRKGIAAGTYSVVFVRSGASGLAKCTAGTGVQLAVDA